MYDWTKATTNEISIKDPVSWVRVTKQKPCCVCSKHDWCTRAADDSVYCCMRVASTVVMGNGGYFHTGESNGCDILSKPQQQRRVIDPSAIMNRWKQFTTDAQVAKYANQLGLTPTSLERLGCVRANQHRHAFAFPMVNATGDVVGIRLRHDNNSKSTVKGSRAGLFVPMDIGLQGLLLICEGPTDTAAMLSLGFDAVGRPSCLGQVSMLRQLLLLFNPMPDIVICADHDGAGLDGARVLATGLLPISQSVRIIKPAKHNDVREWVADGATQEKVLCVIEKAKYWRGD